MAKPHQSHSTETSARARQARAYAGKDAAREGPRLERPASRNWRAQVTRIRIIAEHSGPQPGPWGDDDLLEPEETEK